MNEDQKKDLENRVRSFNDEMIPLLGKYRVGLGAVAFLLPDGRISARPQLFDDTRKPEEKTPEIIKP